MHNRKEGALVLLAVHGGGLAIAAQAWFEMLPEPSLVVVKMVGAAAGLFGLGAVTAYVALRNSGEEGNFYLRAFSEIMSIGAIAGTVGIVFAFSQFAQAPTL